MSEQSKSRPTELEDLRYRVPDSQDPAVVLTALANAGIPAVPKAVDGHSYVIVSLDSQEHDRERIRDVIARRADETSLEGPHFDRRVVFDDES